MRTRIKKQKTRDRRRETGDDSDGDNDGDDLEIGGEIKIFWTAKRRKKG